MLWKAPGAAGLGLVLGWASKGPVVKLGPHTSLLHKKGVSVLHCPDLGEQRGRQYESILFMLSTASFLISILHSDFVIPHQESRSYEVIFVHGLLFKFTFLLGDGC